jgi:threonine synthase
MNFNLFKMFISLARLMGLPIARLIVATNENDVLHRFFNSGTGTIEPRSACSTVSPAIDIQVPYNFERFLYLASQKENQYHKAANAHAPEIVKNYCNQMETHSNLHLPFAKIDPQIVVESTSLFSSASVGTEETLLTISRYFQPPTSYLLDPHSAVGVRAAEKVAFESPSWPTSLQAVPICVLATAHPAKFPETIFKATGQHLTLPPTLKALESKPKHTKTLPKDKHEAALVVVKAIEELNSI